MGINIPRIFNLVLIEPGKSFVRVIQSIGRGIRKAKDKDHIQIWDINNVPLVDSAIKKSELGLNPQIDGQLIRLPIPELNEERRTELKKLINSMGE